MNEILLQKQATIKRCIIRMNEVYSNDSKNLSDLTKQDSIILNLQRICQASIDMAMYVVSTRKLGLPKASQDGLKLLEKADFINSSLSTSLMNMMGFCTIAIHDYPSLDSNVLQAILEKHIDDFLTFAQIVIQLKD
ncbi:type VII toxin-antitoxin system HepT family RNase toxin [Exiguobacterium artemiae]|uniref:type VII toxin-antitoxin system HepT family RNase toxin n=1 Tax=Exiguobacterium artemiae TaxID=340145 RepID=UPI002964BAFE|nr:DUF86 domain-containing protein [Exiguobacterium sibiricum]MDW2884642.1 DUF86 domain-containing protein [Exiguobacterium sibiricum]